MSGVPREPVVLAWNAQSGRSRDLARETGGTAVCFTSPRLSGERWAPVRWLIAGLRTLVLLVRARPARVVVTNPPVFPGLLVALYGLIRPCVLVLDSHPGGFGEQGDRVAARLQPLHRWVARRATRVLVTEQVLAERVRSWGGTPLVLHELLPAGSPPELRALPPRPVVVYVGTFMRDEPVQALVEAGHLLDDEIELVVLGDLRKAPAGLVASAAPHTRFPGFLDVEEYAAAVSGADVVVVLTDDPVSVVRAGYEAVEASRVLVLSDTPALRRYFPDAVHVPGSAIGIAEGVRRALREHDRLTAAAGPARERQRARAAEQRAELLAVLK